MAEEQTELIASKNNDAFADTRMSFGDHLLELRARMIKSIYGLLAGFVFCLIFSDEIISFITIPMLVALRISGLEPQLYVSMAPEAFMTYIKVALYCGIFVSAPWVFYQMWGFVAAGLYPHERRYVNIFAPFSAGLFILGGVFFIIVVAPVSFNFFVNFSQKMQTPSLSRDSVMTRIMMKVVGETFEVLDTDSRDNDTTDQDDGSPTDNKPLVDFKKPLIKPIFTLQQYVTLVAWLAVVFGLAFQMPLAVFLLGRLSIVSLQTLGAMRKYVLFSIFIVAALITPPDVVSQVALGLPMYALYEVGILMLRLWPERKR
ncbi:MAG: twin-arginine translocase subunit TatC [Sedimentisphaerales bacterium]|nr:twin-arginine translocase subunit TatC [Sedimentisphaerales bacterium]